MKKLALLFSGVLLVVLLISCSKNTPTIKESEQHDEEQGQEEDASGEKEKKKATKEEIPSPSYKAMEPTKDASPLTEKVAEEELEQMPSAEARGEDRTRLVPLGETLVKGADDQTDGPLKNHRLIAYYGHPNSSKMGILGEMEPDELMAKPGGEPKPPDSQLCHFHTSMFLSCKYMMKYVWKILRYLIQHTILPSKMPNLLSH